MHNKCSLVWEVATVRVSRDEPAQGFLGPEDRVRAVIRVQDIEPGF